VIKGFIQKSMFVFKIKVPMACPIIRDNTASVIFRPKALCWLCLLLITYLMISLRFLWLQSTPPNPKLFNPNLHLIRKRFWPPFIVYSIYPSCNPNFVKSEAFSASQQLQIWFRRSWLYLHLSIVYLCQQYSVIIFSTSMTKL